ncbi:MAG: hypothetical protein WA885_17850 [Phormidesmis sp.]
MKPKLAAISLFLTSFVSILCFVAPVHATSYAPGEDAKERVLFEQAMQAVQAVQEQVQAEEAALIIIRPVSDYSRPDPYRLIAAARSKQAKWMRDHSAFARSPKLPFTQINRWVMAALPTKSDQLQTNIRQLPTRLKGTVASVIYPPIARVRLQIEQAKQQVKEKTSRWLRQVGAKANQAAEQLQ